ncbi:hypothetical protein AC626_08500 [Pseudoalteromonas rubra]|uniref:Uncharacterized protein n=1 Tax=Pseudoalteromonas rubra TaxID=43658 RepID=A0A0L0ETV3_9GAMM|nr:hypothetical protein AC626_08500 [Pseudoalteromonas rubra]
MAGKQVTSFSNIDFENGSVIFRGRVCERRGLLKKLQVVTKAQFKQNQIALCKGLAVYLAISQDRPADQ